MKLKNFKIIIIISIIIIILVGLFSITSKDKDLEEIRLGYMPIWAEGSLPVQALRDANIAENNNLNISYAKFHYGPPLIEAALSKRIDVLFTGWVPAINLMTKSDDWVIIAKLNYFPAALMAREGTNLKEITDLENKKIGVPHGASGLYPIVVMELKDNNLIHGKNVELINIQPADMSVSLSAKRVDAIAWAEPLITILEKQEIAYPLKEYTDIGFIVISKDYLERNPEKVTKFLNAFKESMLYVSKNKEETYNWFSKDSLYDIDLIESLRYSDPNFNAKNIQDIDLTINQYWIDITQEKIDFMYQEGIIDKRIILLEKINLEYIPN